MCNVTEAAARTSNYNRQEKLDAKSLGWLKVNTHTINIIEIQCSWTSNKSLDSSFPHNLCLLINIVLEKSRLHFWIT